ncbi:hypothetical protein V6N12_009792 [Hibiscus sabdariffa]|uniref:Uncharacterized protein n=1 Tax=Hibiscus sabdariffa TaxID=183260 RepID=A0ABR2EDI2_9ROSI
MGFSDMQENIRALRVTSGNVHAANVEIIVADISTFEMEASLDMIYSIEMFELKRMEKNLAAIKPIMKTTYGMDQAVKWIVYWQTVFIAVVELFGYNGEEWMVAVFLFKKKCSPQCSFPPLKEK